MKKISLGEIIAPSVITVSPLTPVNDVLTIMEDRRISCVVAINEIHQPLGIFTEQDAISLMARHDKIADLSMAEVMSAPPLTAPAELDFREAYHRISDKGFRHIVVVDAAGKLLGVASEADFMHHMGMEYLVELKTVANTMTRKVLTLGMSATLDDAAILMAQHKISCVLIAEADRIPLGVLTERDIVSLARTVVDATQVRITRVMKSPVQTIRGDMPLQEAMQQMERNQVRRLVVTEQGKIAGLITRHDIVKAIQGRYIEFLHATLEQQRLALEQSKTLIQEAQQQLLTHSLMEQIQDSIVVFKADCGSVVEINDQACRNLGYTRDELLQLSIFDISPFSSATSWQTELENYTREGHRLTQTVHIRHDGSVYPVEMSARLIERDSERYIVAIARDLSERLLAESQLREAAAVLRSTHEGVVITDTVPQIVAVNPAYSKITGYSAEEAVGQKPGYISSGRQDAVFYAEVWDKLLTAGYWQGEMWNRRKNGEIYPQLITISAIFDENKTPTRYVGVFSDITELKEKQSKLEFMANHDPLTLLPNRALVETQLQRELERALRHEQKLAVLFVDLDRFKNINDSYGHLAGDELLCAVADRLSLRLRDGDTLGRLGGDEFILLLNSLNVPQDAAIVARDLIQTLSEPFTLSSSNEVFISASVGISLFPSNGKSVTDLMKNADAAMYQAKESGRNQFSFYIKTLNEGARSKLTLENELRHAIAEQHLSLHYQPKVNLRSGKICGAEALIRWQQPDGNMVPPDEFIPLAERSGLILAIGQWVIEHACWQMRTWLDAGMSDINVAINVSARQFRSGHLEKQIAEALAKHQLPGHHLEVELTESMLMMDLNQAIAIMQQLKKLGIKLSLDDFGTGYSNLGYLSRFPIDTLKIDRSFVQKSVDEPDAAEITSAIIGLAHRMNLSVIGEGAENLAQLNFLRHNGCDQLQGFYFSRPLSADKFAELIRSDKRLSLDED